MFSSIAYKKFKSKRKFGIEIEMNNSIAKKKIGSLIEKISGHRVVVGRYSLSISNDYWHIKDDATCGDLGKGVEIATFIAQGHDQLMHISNVIECLKSIGCKTNNKCGLHIHADASDLKEAQIGTLLAYWIKIENILEEALPEFRRNNEYCYPIGRTRGIINYSKIGNLKWHPLDLWFLYKPNNINYFQNEDRRVNLNLVNYTRALATKTELRKTLELRWPEGTLSALDIRCWTRLFLGFIDNCKNKKMPKNLLPADLEESMSILGFHHNGETFNILSEELYETRKWFLDRISKYSNN